MTNKELMYAFAQNYRDEILIDLVRRADEIFENETVYNLVSTVVDLETKDREGRYRCVMLDIEPLRFSDASAYRTVLYNLLIRDNY